MIALLEPLFRGDLAPHGEALQCAPHPPAGALRVADLVRSPDLLGRVLRQHAAHLGVAGADLRAVASAWSLRYLGTLLPPTAAAASVLQHVFPMAADQVWVRLDAHAHPLSFHIRELGRPQRGASTQARYSALLREHLEPLFSALRHLTGIATKILWGNAARNLEPVLDQALALTGGAAPIANDRQQLLHNPAWGAGSPSSNEANGADAADAADAFEAVEMVWANPLPGPQREIRVRFQGRDQAVKLHRQCCLLHLLPGEGYCGVCPLSPKHR
ncbi:siderophore-iron reductase FhuF [Variovorax sp. H27-G14]|uniref:siderophore-iron reductase FhuF n=1 Tax=Variovorax sp. H27-G14 TaxID=3111914 RepID=UPI0038FCE8CE